MDRRSDAIRRLGGPARCTACGSRPHGEHGRGLVNGRCSDCHLSEVQQIQNRVDRRLALHDTSRAGDPGYRQACEAMEADVAAALDDWPMGNGIIGPRY